MPPIRQRDLLRVDVREVERGRDEVGDDVDADGRGRERQRCQHDREGVVDLADRLDRVGDELAVDRQRRRRGEHGQQREHREVHRQAPEVAALDRLERLAVAREVTEVEHRPREVRDDQSRRGTHRRDDGRPGELLGRQVEADVPVALDSR